MTNENDYHYKEAKATEAFKAIDDGIRKYTKSTEYLLCWAVTGSAINNIALNEDVTYKLSSPIKVLLQTEADAAKENSSSGGGAVIPSGGGSAGGSTDTKKDDAKKTDDKKNDTKKDDTKTPSTDNTAKPVKKATAKTATLKVKTTDKAVVSQLTKSGTKLVAKSVYKVTVKNATKAITSTVKVNLGKKAKTVYILDLKTGKTIKASYKNGKVTFKTKKSIAKFVIVNKATKRK